jgi:hypothetical protein
MMVIHVVVAFRPGHPEVSPRNPLFSALKANGMAVAGTEGAPIHPTAAAREGTDSGQAPHQPVRWHGPGDAAARRRHRPDRDAEVRAMPLDLVIPTQAAVVTMAELAAVGRLRAACQADEGPTHYRVLARR